MAERKTKKKREIPLRSPGAPVATPTSRPSLLLFDEVKRLEDLDSQNVTSEISETEDFGNPNPSEPDIQNNSLGNPNRSGLDIQIQNLGDPNEIKPDIRSKNVGYPNPEILDSKIAKAEKRISKGKVDLDSRIAGAEISDSQKQEKKTDWAKYDTKRKAKGVFLRTGDEITKRFKQFCIGQEWDFSEGTEIAWNKLMNDLDIQKTGDLDSLIAHDDRRLKMLFKSKAFIINLYLAYTSVFNELASGDGKKWSGKWLPRDDTAGARYNELAPSIVELGILQTQIQKGFGTSRIQTFKYYTDEIEKVLSSGVSDEMLATILTYHRNIWKNQTGREVDLSFLDAK